MTIDESIKKYGSAYGVCKALGVSPQNFTRWKKQGWIPQAQQLRLEKITNGELKADEFGPDRRPIKK
ncbi:Cro/CI family transcriptional regulator [Legionella micdadei]|uniref:DNA-binding transcriptional regulator Cro n=1 Tax=Legionella micdadei TaxID=451 RepID=A0A098GET2_LEGMI|nr:Cro/CI family transcriptional regulator [Legionella micdadei]KTD27506.1 hypothetical protein Lmic_2135 [Legionella micdadei]CEG60983.1 protein of unknown function [Lambda repressor-like, DNA-binding] [Legionella micdadei]SCY69991.1 DNA-binding transcriptional regulator Cro [Legionella micdadei]